MGRKLILYREDMMENVAGHHRFANDEEQIQRDEGKSITVNHVPRPPRLWSRLLAIAYHHFKCTMSAG